MNWDYFTHYLEANIVCIVIFGILLFHDYRNVDRQEKQVKYDLTLAAFILYFIADIIWAAVSVNIIERTVYVVLGCNFAIYFFMAGITIAWLQYAMAVEKVPNRNTKASRWGIVSPFILSTVGLIITYLVDDGRLFDDDLNPIYGYYIFLIVVPVINIVAVMVYALRRLKNEDNPIERRRHIYVGFFPLMVVIGGLVQVFILPEIPIFCYTCAVFMLIFYLKAMETQISVDPLTGLNNRGQLLRYISNKSNLHIEGRQTFVIMMDINYFKDINDTHGHAEGDRALIILADAIIHAVKGREMPAFIGRYGGDEFILIIHPQDKVEIESLIAEFRQRISESCRDLNTPYTLSVGAGYDELLDEPDTIQKCMQRADKKLYLDKEYVKLQLKAAAEAAES